MLIHKILLRERLWNIAYFYTQETKTQKYSGFGKKKRNPVPDHDKLGSLPMPKFSITRTGKTAAKLMGDLKNRRETGIDVLICIFSLNKILCFMW